MAEHLIITKDIAALRDELYKNFASKADIAESKADMIKWMFIFVFSSTLLTIVSILAIVNFFFINYSFYLIPFCSKCLLY